MIGVAVLINAILVPIMAQMGVFHRARGTRLTPVTLVKLPPPEKNPAEHKAKKVPPKRQAPRGAKPHESSSRPLPPNPNQPKVVAASPSDSDEGGATIANNGTAAPGQVVAPAPAPREEAASALVTPPSPPKPAPEPAPVAPPKPPAPPPPHVPVIVAAKPLDRPEPSIPDELRNDDLSATFMALFDIQPDGSATVSTQRSTGNQTLDRLAIDAARKWTFRPATRDGQPVRSYLRLEIDFKVAD